MSRIALVLLIMVALQLSGCIGAAVEGVATAKDVTSRSDLETSADAGDPVAQYQLGHSYCCIVGPQGGPPVVKKLRPYNNQLATEWLCKAAQQDYGPAQYKLALIYSGNPFGDNLRLMRRGAARVDSALREQQTNMSVALLWARLAAEKNIDGAADLAASIAGSLTPDQIQKAGRLQQNWKSAPCTWTEVFGS